MSDFFGPVGTANLDSVLLCKFLVREVCFPCVGCVHSLESSCLMPFGCHFSGLVEFMVQGSFLPYGVCTGSVDPGFLFLSLLPGGLASSD